MHRVAVFLAQAPETAVAHLAAFRAGFVSVPLFSLFGDDALRMRAMTLMIVVGMSGFILGPLLGGTVLAHFRWEWLLAVNAPIALIAWIGVRLGVPADHPQHSLTETFMTPTRRRLAA